MHKKAAKRNTCNLLIQNTKTSDKFSSVKDYKNNDTECSEHFQLPSLQKKKTWKDVHSQVSTWDESGKETICSSSLTELEAITTAKVVQQWDAIENTLYEDGNQVTQTALLEECTQWRKQMPHLRIVGKNPFLATKDKYVNLGKNTDQLKSSVDSFNDDILPELSHSIKEKKTSSKHKLQSILQEKILNILFDYVASELFLSKENEIEKDFDKVFQERMVPVHSNKSSAKSTKMTWFEETIPLDNTFSSGRDKLIEEHIIPLKKETIHANLQENQKKYDNLKFNDGAKNGQDNTFSAEDTFLRSHTSRNKLGTVFNEKIVVSPVPYILSTRESFSTIKTTPIKFMEQPLNVSTFQGNSLTPTKYSNYQSAWHATVSPAVWSKNVKLAPLDTSRLPSSKNRSLTSSSVVLQRNRKPLSPISRSTPPVSAQTTHNSKAAEIQGRHISSGQSPKLSVINIGSDHNIKISKNKKKRSQSKRKL